LAVDRSSLPGGLVGGFGGLALFVSISLSGAGRGGGGGLVGGLSAGFCSSSLSDIISPGGFDG